MLSFFSQARANLKSTKLSLHWEELFENTARMRSSQAIVYNTPSSRENLNLPGIWTTKVPEDISIITWLPNIHFDHNHCLKLLLIPIQVKPNNRNKTPPQSQCIPPNSPPKQKNLILEINENSFLTQRLLPIKYHLETK